MDNHIKICSKCKLELPETAEYFHKQKDGKNGLKSECKTCNLAQQKERYNARPDVQEKRANPASRTKPVTETKACTKCEQTFPATLEFFPKRSGAYDGLQAYCRACQSLQKAAYHAANKERQNQYNKEYYTKNAEKIQQQNQEWREKNPEKIKEFAKRRTELHREELIEYQKEYRKNNSEKLKQSQKSWQARNRERIKEYNKRRWQPKTDEDRKKQAEKMRRWREDNPDRAASAHNRRRVSEVGAEGHFTHEDVTKMRKEQNELCYYCKERKKLTVDHKIPLSRGGSDWPDNICLACGQCNSQKNNKTEEEYWVWREERGL